MVRSAALSLALIASSAMGVAAADSTAPAVPLSGPRVGAPAPAFALRTLDGKHVSLATYRGKTLVINVWATWCPPCRQEMPELVSSARALQKSGVAVLGVDTTENAPIVRAYVAAKNVAYPQAIDGEKSFATAYDVQYFPTTFVIDGAGILRARYIDVLDGRELRTLVAAADAGSDAVITSPLQTQIDAALAPASFAFGDDAATNEKTATSVNAAIATAEDLLDRSDAASKNATDLLRTRAEEATLRDRAIAALANVAAPADPSLLPLLRADAARDREQWQAAIDAYASVLVLDPKNGDALEGTALAASRLKNYPLVVDADTKLVALAPADSSALVNLGRAQATAGTLPAAYASFDAAVRVAEAAVTAQPRDPKLRRALAYAHLYYGRVLQTAGERARARDEFGRTLAQARLLPLKDARRDMYVEEGQEALVSLQLGRATAGATLSVAPWTGPVLPGSIPNTIKYRVVVAGDSGKNVLLKATEVPKGWVASFCSDRVCSPGRVAVTIPSSGVKIVEFQLVPPGAETSAPNVRITSSGDGPPSSVTTQSS